MPKLIPYLINAIPKEGYQLFVEFEDGVKGVIDLEMWKGKGVFKYWDDKENFKNFRLTEDKKLEWDEEIDMDPDAFYLQLSGKTFSEYAGDQQFLRNTY